MEELLALLTTWLEILALVIGIFIAIAFLNIFGNKKKYQDLKEKADESLLKVSSTIEENEKIQIDIQKKAKNIDEKFTIMERNLEFKIVYYEAISKYKSSELVMLAYSDDDNGPSEGIDSIRHLVSDYELDQMDSIIESFKKAEQLASDKERLFLLQNLGVCYILRAQLGFMQIRQEYSSDNKLMSENLTYEPYEKNVYKPYELGVKYLNKVFEEDLSLSNDDYIGGVYYENFSHIANLVSGLQITTNLYEGNKLLLNFKNAFEKEFNLENIEEQINRDTTDVCIFVYVRLLSSMKYNIDRNRFTGKHIIDSEINKFKDFFNESFFEGLIIKDDYYIL